MLKADKPNSIENYLIKMFSLLYFYIIKTIINNDYYHGYVALNQIDIVIQFQYNFYLVNNLSEFSIWISIKIEKKKIKVINE